MGKEIEFEKLAIESAIRDFLSTCFIELLEDGPEIMFNQDEMDKAVKKLWEMTK